MELIKSIFLDSINIEWKNNKQYIIHFYIELKWIRDKEYNIYYIWDKDYFDLYNDYDEVFKSSKWYKKLEELFNLFKEKCNNEKLLEWYTLNNIDSYKEYERIYVWF